MLLVILRILLPSIVLHFANKRLATMPGYYGHIDDIDIALWRGAYKIKHIYLNKVDSLTNKQTPFFAAGLIDLSVQWEALFHGSIVGELELDSVGMRFTKDKVEPVQVKNDHGTLKDLVDDFMPLDINRFEVRNGSLQYVDEHRKPPVNIRTTNTYILATNLKNVEDSAVVLPSTVVSTGDIYGGKMSFNMKINPLAVDPTFDMNIELKNTHLVQLNPFFHSYAHLDVNKGTFDLYGEAAAKNGKFKGYVKPIIKNLDVLGPEDAKDSFFQKLYEGLVGTVADFLKNRRTKEIATKVPFEGSTEKMQGDSWYVVAVILRNAFIEALKNSIDREIDISNVNKKSEHKSFWEGLFGK
ncbi:MAG TPA: DUF748 domain-containing protein [Candidatus Kapabacteria bacterium]|nr:DUF748 domain-containing protein [Candidatus Kapabacteria bacterium]